MWVFFFVHKSASEGCRIPLAICLRQNWENTTVLTFGRHEITLCGNEEHSFTYVYLRFAITKCQGVEHYFLSAASVSLANTSDNYVGSFGVASRSVM